MKLDVAAPKDTDASAAVALHAVRFRYPGADDDALRITDFSVAAGEHVFVRGPSGCGKTTLLSLVAGVLVATEGEVSLRGRDWADLSSSARDHVRADHIGYIFQGGFKTEVQQPGY